MNKHSVFLKEDKCEGCTNCVKKCPTKAIRVHQGRAWIKENLCIDCSECIRTCEYHAKYTQTDQLADLKKHKYPVVLVPPSFYGQFSADIEPGKIKAALVRTGFKKVYDVADAAAALSRKTFSFLEENKGSFISSSCPVVVRLIKLIYPDLLELLLPLKSPVELMAGKIRKEIKVSMNISKEEIGVYFLTPCPAKLTTVTNPLGLKDSALTGAIGVETIYQKVLSCLGEVKAAEIEAYNTLDSAVIWGQSGGEANILKSKQKWGVISVTGIHNVKSVLEEIERNNISGVKYFELVACRDGCVGGVLNVINPFQARFNIERRVAQIVSQENGANKQNKLGIKFNFDMDYSFIADNQDILDADFTRAVAKLALVDKEVEILPGLDCAACGAPDCKTLAEDIVNGLANRSDCIFMLRKEVGKLADKMSNLAHELPPVMSRKEEQHESKTDS